MSTEADDGADLQARVTSFLERNFPQIWMHGGTAAIEKIDPEAGEVHLRLGGACSGCGISPMTVQAIKSRMASEIPEIETVYADAVEAAGGGPSGGAAGTGRPSRGSHPDPDDSADAPF